MIRTNRWTFAVLLSALMSAGVMSMQACAQDQATGVEVEEVTPATQPAPLPLPTLPPETPADRKVRQKLADTIVSFTFNEQPVMEALDFLQTLGNINIVVDRSKLGDPGQTVTLKLANVPLEAALRLVAEQFGLTCVVRDGVVFISDAEGVMPPPIRLVYDVKDLANLENVRFEMREKALAEAIEELQKVIVETIAPETWNAGGNAIAGLPKLGTIVITHRLDVHRQVRELITDLRRRQEARELRTQLEKLQKQMDEARNKRGYTEKHPALAELSARIQELRERLVAAEGPDAAPVTRTFLVNDLLVFPVDEKIKATAEERLKLLVDFITENVAPGTWGEDSGNSIRARQAQMVVTHRPDVQTKVAEFLKVLRLDRDLIRGRKSAETKVSF